MKYITEEMWPGSFGIDETDRSWELLLEGQEVAIMRFLFSWGTHGR
ncbi:MAG: hypothetical protein LBP24_02520 [Coriobacteriales bacterium]|jgi:hypothetical protein|nr:hypothetical protein [Coriobacteriales bacterium]